MINSIRPLIASTAIAAAIVSLHTVSLAADPTPWIEKVVHAHVDRTEFRGPLTGDQISDLVNAGENLFTGKFTELDGAGRPKATQAIVPTKRRHAARSAFQRLPGPDATACSSCHNEPLAGGAGDVTANVFVSEGFTNPDFDTTDPQFSNERNTNHLFGAGLVELLAREMTADLLAARDRGLAAAKRNGKPVVVSLETKGVSFGSITAMPDGILDFSELDGVDSDLIVRPFSQKGVFTSLRQFSVNAMNHHHGMQADERFGARWTGEDDFDEDGKKHELSEGDISALVAWQATLPPPVKMVPQQEAWQKMAIAGEQLFAEFGCASCHVPALPLESSLFSDPGPYGSSGTLTNADVDQPAEYDLNFLEEVKNLPRNAEGRIMVPLYSDLKRHRISDQKVAAFGNELLAQRFVERDQFQTSELWGIASTAPYGHRGNFTTLDSVIRAHGGDASSSELAYRSAEDHDRQAIIAFLKTLVIGQ